jgi:hypothetical protein
VKWDESEQPRLLVFIRVRPAGGLVEFGMPVLGRTGVRSWTVKESQDRQQLIRSVDKPGPAVHPQNTGSRGCSHSGMVVDSIELENELVIVGHIRPT